MVKVKPVGQDGQDGQDGQNGPVGQDGQNGPDGPDAGWADWSDWSDLVTSGHQIFGLSLPPLSLPRGHVDLTASPTVKIGLCPVDASRLPAVCST